MKTMSTGQPSTLGNWHAMTKAVFGEDSPATLFLQDKIDKQGSDEEVIADEGQLLHALYIIHRDKRYPPDART